MQNKFFVLLFFFIFVSCASNSTNDYVFLGAFDTSTKSRIREYESKEIWTKRDFYSCEFVINQNNPDCLKYYDFHFYDIEKEMYNKFTEIGYIYDDYQCVYEYENINNLKGNYFINFNGRVGDPNGKYVENPTIYFWSPEEFFPKKNWKELKETKINRKTENVPYVFELNEIRKNYIITYDFLYFDLQNEEINNDYIFITKKYFSGKEEYFEKQIEKTDTTDTTEYFFPKEFILDTNQYEKVWKKVNIRF